MNLKRKFFIITLFVTSLIAIMLTALFINPPTAPAQAPNIKYFRNLEHYDLELEKYVRIIDLKKNEILTIEGFVNRTDESHKPFILFYRYDEEGRIRINYVKLFNISRNYGIGIVRVTGKIDHVYPGDGGDVSVMQMEVIRTVEQVRESIEIVNEHWRDFFVELKEKYSAPVKDGRVWGGVPMWSEKNRELILFHNVGKMVRDPFYGDFNYESVADVFYFIEDKTITTILIFEYSE